MQVSVETTSGLGRRMKVQIPAEQVDRQVDSKLRQLSRTVRMDGFRPGKVPLSVVRKRYGSQVRQETAAELITQTYEQALQQENLRPAGEPDIEQTRNEAGAGLEYVATFEVFPDIEIPALDDLAIERPLCEIGEQDIDAMVEKLRRQRMTWQEVDRPAAEGDRVVIDFEGHIDGEPFSGNKASQVPLELGSGAMIPGFEQQLIGVGKGDEKTIEVTFPEDYGSAEVAGKTAQFAIRVDSVAEPVLPELDDDFARSFGVGDGGLAALREEVRRNMSRELEAAVKSRLKKQVFEAMLERAQIEVPAAFIESEVEGLIKKSGASADADIDRSRFEQEARDRVVLGLLVSEIIKQNQLTVDPDRVRRTIEDMAQSYENPQEVVQWYYSNQDMLAGVQTLVMEEIVVEWVTAQAQVEDKPQSFEELMKSVSA
ncbi:MAG TPA: trigger factor [Gammaproteobacteria bacterium]|nr:trigger factor [Gammaproteobacteria bacterium]